MTVPVDPPFEHGVLVNIGTVEVEGVNVEPTHLVYAGVGKTQLRIANTGMCTVRVPFVGGEPFKESIVMWWNFIGCDY